MECCQCLSTLINGSAAGAREAAAAAFVGTRETHAKSKAIVDISLAVHPAAGVCEAAAGRQPADGPGGTVSGGGSGRSSGSRGARRRRRLLRAPWQAHPHLRRPPAHVGGHRRHQGRPPPPGARVEYNMYHTLDVDFKRHASACKPCAAAVSTRWDPHYAAQQQPPQSMLLWGCRVLLIWLLPAAQ